MRIIPPEILILEYFYVGNRKKQISEKEETQNEQIREIGADAA